LVIITVTWGISFVGRKDKAFCERPFALHRQQCSLRAAQLRSTTRMLLGEIFS